MSGVMVKRFVFLNLLALLIGSCGGGASNSPGNSVTNKVEKALDTGPAGQTVAINSPDGLVLIGTYCEAEKPGTPAILLLHQWQSDRHSWDDFAKEMQRDGFNVLSIDGRGFGESPMKTDGSTVAAGRTDADVKAMLGDVDAAFNFLSKQKNVDPKRVGIIGASYGSSLAIIYAVDHPNVAAVALMSPGTNYFGNMQTEPAIAKYGDRPLFMTAAEDDPDSFNSVTKLNDATGEPRRAVVVTVPKGGHGTALLAVDGVRKPLKTFCEERLGGIAPKP
jgi:dienelactone hydrolase